MTDAEKVLATEEIVNKLESTLNNLKGTLNEEMLDLSMTFISLGTQSMGLGDMTPIRLEIMQRKRKINEKAVILYRAVDYLGAIRSLGVEDDDGGEF